MVGPLRSRLRLLLVPGVLFSVAAAAIVGPNLIVAHSAQGYDYAVVSTVPPRSVAIVPGARVYNGKPFIHLEARLQAALDLYRAGQVKAILVSGLNTDESPEVTAMRTWLLEHGVPADHIWSDEKGFRTREAMSRAVSEFGVMSAVVCTQEVNMNRTLFLAQQAGIDAVGLSLPSALERSRRYVAMEALKTTLAFFESQVRARPTPTATETTSAVASR
jgi:vancomycin permeability regulator SanA